MQNVGYERAMRILITFLRNRIEDPAKRGSDAIETFIGDGATREFFLSNKLLTNVKSVKVDDRELIEFVDYETKYDNPVEESSYPSVVLNEAPSSDSNIIISYHCGESWIYQAHPSQEFVSPQVSLFHISTREELHSLGLLETPHTRSTKGVTWLQIGVWTRRTPVYTIDGEKYSGNKLKDKIADDIVKALTQERILLKRQGLESLVIRMARDVEFEEREGVYRKEIDVEFVHTIEYSI